MISERMNADILVKTSDVDGVYTKDPKKYPDAKKVEELKFKDLVRLFEKNKHKAGIHQILDPEAIKILQKGRTKVVVVNGFRPKNVLSALKGEKVGTTIQ
jgi:uridylate kinase